MLVIKKYANRRLYDTSASRYVTLEDLASLIRAGADVVVQDAHSGADLTQVTLTQIILESRGGARLLPIPLLVRLIRLGDEALAEFLGRYVSWALELYVQAKQGARSFLPLNPLATAPFAATDALARLLLGGSPWAQRDAGRAAPPPPPPSVPEPAPAPYSDDSSMPAYPGDLVHAAPEPAEVEAQVRGVADEMQRMRAELERLKESLTAPPRARALKRRPKKTSAARPKRPR